MTLAAWLHDLNPFIWRFSESFGIRWYGLAYALGFVLAGLQLAWLAKRNASLIPKPQVYDALMFLLFGVIVGGRVGYVLIYDRALLSQFEPSFPWWGLLMINRGGMSFHGALVGLLGGAWFVSRHLVRRDDGTRLSLPYAHVCDLIAFIVPPGLMLGRLANFINGELLGKIVAPPGAPAPWWAVRFPQELEGPHAPPLTPVQQADFASLLDRFGQREHGPEHALAKLLDAVQNHSFTGHAQLLSDVASITSARHPSQLYQAFVEGPLLMLVLWALWRRPRPAGLITGVFLIVYGITRFIIEQYFRLPDAQFANGRPGGLSRGQWLCAGMVVGGICVIVLALTKRTQKLGGWGKRSEAVT